MNNKTISLRSLLCLLMSLAMVLSLCACGAANQTQPEDGNSVSSAAADEDTSLVEIPNPVLEVDEAGQLEKTGVALHAPEGAADELRTVIQAEGESPIAAIAFTYEGKPYEYRCQSTASVDAPDDISGMYFDWTEETEAEVQGRAAQVRVCDEAGCVLWLDVVPGFTYALSCTESVDAQTLVNVANLVFEELQGDS